MIDIMEANKKSYNKIAEKWHENRNRSPLNNCVIDFVSKIKPNGKVLDIGCGTGYPIAKYLSEQGFNVTGIDISESMLQKAKELNLPNTKLYLCDFFDFNPTEKYDAVIAFDSFFHFPKDKQSQIYNKISDWTSMGAYLLFTGGKIDGEIEGNMYGEPFYYSALATSEVHKLLSYNGFTVETSIENYKEPTSGERDLLIIAKKLT